MKHVTKTRPCLGFGNLKLGKHAGSYSRPVGATCPADCPFLCGVMPDGSDVPKKHRCYKKRIDVRRPNVRESAERNLEVDVEWIDNLRKDIARKKTEAWRPHVGGDFLRDGKLDRKYLAALLWAARHSTKPAWVYTHAWRELAPHVRYLKQAGFAVYASVHWEPDARRASELGYLLAIDQGEGKTKPGWREIFGVRALQCPEQVKGSEAVTCDRCRFCARGKGNVIFTRH